MSRSSEANEIRSTVQNEATKLALSRKTGTLDISMRLGKTKIGLQIASNFDKVLVSYPNSPIKVSWETDSSKFNIPIDNITFTTHLSLNKHKLEEFDCVILDEIHDVSEDKIEYIKSNLPKRLYGLTGTPATIGIKKQFMKSYCPIIYEKKLDDIAGILVKNYEIKVHLLNPCENKNIQLKSGKYWSEKAQIDFFDRKYEDSKDFKMMLILIRAIQNSQTKFDYLKKLTKEIKRGLFFLETVKQCEELGYPAYHTKEPKSEDNLNNFQLGKINKMSSILQLKAGITFEDLEEVVLLHCYSSSNKAAQRIGRALNYSEDKALVHILALKDTRDIDWIKKGLSGFDFNKIKYYEIK